MITKIELVADKNNKKDILLKVDDKVINLHRVLEMSIKISAEDENYISVNFIKCEDKHNE